jgi:hypothetical protein
MRIRRRDLVKETQRAITNATISVNETLNAARAARKLKFQEKQRDTSRLRNQRKGEREEANQFHSEMQQNRQGLLSLQRQLSSRAIQARTRVEQERRSARLNTIMQESNFKSQIYRDHQRALKEERDKRRRDSTQARAKLRQNHREGEERLRAIQMEQDLAVIEERHEGYNASRHFQKSVAEARRKSFAFRSGDARRIRELYNRMQEVERQREHASFELKLAGERDAEAYKRKLEEDRRNSLAFRNKEGLRQRILLSDQQQMNLAQEHASYELKWAGEKDAEAYMRQMEEERRKSLEQRNKTSKQQADWKEEQRTKSVMEEHESILLKLAGERDADAYRKKMADTRRESLAQRNAYAKQQRDEQEEMDRKTQLAEHESYEFKWAGESDAEAYRRKMNQERRESLAARNKESAQHSKVMEELRLIAHEKETESLALMWAGERDAKAYLARMEEERRQSLQFRGQEVRRHRQIEDEQRHKEIEDMHQDELLRAAGHRDMDDYKKECAQRDRDSLCFRRKEANVQRLEEKRRKQEEYEIEQSNLALEDGAYRDVAEYLKECRERRRMSLALRAKEKRHHRNWEQQQTVKALAQQQEDTRLRGLDRRQAEMARQEERRRIALDAIRHAGCSFNVNAFTLS